MSGHDDLFRCSHGETLYVTVPPIHAPSTSWWVAAGDDVAEFRRQRDQRLADMKQARFGQASVTLIIDGFAR